MAAKALPPRDVLRQLLSYDPETGKLFWREAWTGWFTDGYHSAVARSRQWNSKNANKEAFTAITTGYRWRYRQCELLAHRVIWKMVAGTEPDQIDHISGVNSDGKWANLRDVDETHNKREYGIPRHNTTSGAIGVSFDSSRNGRPTLRSIIRKMSLGRHDSFEAAFAARKAAEPGNGFHPNHGRAA